MIISCAPEIFKQFEKGCGGDVTPDRKGQEFLYDALGVGLEFFGLIKIEIPNSMTRNLATGINLNIGVMILNWV